MIASESSTPDRLNRRRVPKQEPGGTRTGWPPAGPADRRTALRQTAGVGVGLDHERRHRTDEHCLRDAALAVAGNVMDDLAATGGVADMNGVVEIEMCGQSGWVIGIVVPS